ncbi:MAG: hypothetical protein QXR29_01530 [Candidatus Micrarchaeaceae archaeon]
MAFYGLFISFAITIALVELGSAIYMIFYSNSLAAAYLQSASAIKVASLVSSAQNLQLLSGAAELSNMNATVRAGAVIVSDGITYIAAK